ncbi:MAG: hypothetical protein GF390_00515 [Candidatus Pacebacteria bacterium]|nr:hypothetical protein [Candidatus Paceibacterota bacterium]
MPAKIDHFKPITLILTITLVAAAFLRLYNLAGSLQFLGDQGRDALIVSKIFKEKDPVFIGPVTSVGNMYLGPFYYYLMLPFLWLSYPSPMGPVYAVAALGILTVWLTYRLGKELIGAKAAIIASIFLAFSATVVEYSRFSWNPNPAPFFSLLMIYFTYKAWKSHPKFWLVVAGCFSILIQLHYLTLLSLGGAGVIWLIQLAELIKSNSKIKKAKLFKFALITLISMMIFLASLTPLILFDWKHNWLNAKAFQYLFTQEQNFKHSAPLNFTQQLQQTLQDAQGRAGLILFEYNLGQNRHLNRDLTYLVLAALAYWLISRYRQQQLTQQKNAGLIVILAYLITGIMGVATYEHQVYYHYIAYLFPVTALVYGFIIAWWSQHALGKVLGLIFFGYFLQINLTNMPLQDTGWTLAEISQTSQEILQHLEPDDQYNLVLLSESKDLYGQNYRYFLSTSNNPPLDPTANSQAQKLVIINEAQAVQNVTGLPIYEIVQFQDSQISDQFRINNGPEITILAK